MRYIEVTVNTPEEEIDLRCQQMADMGAGGFVIENEADFQAFLENNHQYWDYVDQELEDKFKGLSRIKCYLTDDEEGLAVLRSIKAAYSDVETGFVEDSDWENNWREYYKPIQVGEKLVVVPEWEEIPQDGRLPLRLDPGLIFGTGSHATTRLCLQALDKCIHGGEKILDLGCGSGILSIAALVLGAKEAFACDIDEKCVDVAYENAALNGVGKDRYTVRWGDVLTDTTLQAEFGGGYDMVVANIVADVIMGLSDKVRPFLKEGGLFLCSGIIDDRAEEVLAKLRADGWMVLEQNDSEGWYSFLCR